jgi:CsoR family transcriptional regulator, copper-sensing transcriptional repressor
LTVDRAGRCGRRDRLWSLEPAVRQEEIAVNENPIAVAEPCHEKTASYAADRAKILTRLRRIEGQVRGVARMVEEDKYCVDILTQISAAVAGLRATGLLVLEDHIRGCVISAEPEKQEETLQELMGAIERFSVVSK